MSNRLTRIKNKIQMGQDGGIIDLVKMHYHFSPDLINDLKNINKTRIKKEFPRLRICMLGDSLISCRTYNRYMQRKSLEPFTRI